MVLCECEGGWECCVSVEEGGRERESCVSVREVGGGLV